MTEPTCKTRFTVRLPDHWTPDQALAVFEFVDELREAIWTHYHERLVEAYRELWEANDGGPSSDVPPRDISF
jgi:hypothetical protein